MKCNESQSLASRYSDVPLILSLSCLQKLPDEFVLDLDLEDIQLVERSATNPLIQVSSIGSVLPADSVGFLPVHDSMNAACLCRTLDGCGSSSSSSRYQIRAQNWRSPHACASLSPPREMSCCGHVKQNYPLYWVAAAHSGGRGVEDCWQRQPGEGADSHHWSQ